MSWNVSELERRIANIIRVGVVAELDESGARVKVRIGEILTAPLPWLTSRAGPDRTYWAPEPGEQVLLLSPSGDLAQAVVLPSIYQEASPAPADLKTVHRTVYADGTKTEYDRKNHVLTVDCVGSVVVKGATTLLCDFGGDITLKSGTQVTIDAPDSTVTGTLTVQGLLSYQAGMAGQGAGDGAAATIQGNVLVSGGDVTVDGVGVKSHHHTGDDGGNTSNSLV